MFACFIFFYAFVNVGRGQSPCYTAFECANRTIVHNTSEEDVVCAGYGSCSMGNISNYEIGSDTECFGSRSCQSGSKYMTKTNTFATGYLGLAYTDFVSSHNIDCHGEGSCHNIEYLEICQMRATGLLSADSITLSVKCFNETKSEIRAMGMFAFRNSIIYTNSSLNISFYGYYSGHNTTIYCQSGDYCNINCFVNGCENLNVYCMPNSSFNTSLIDLNSIDFNTIDNNYNCHVSCNESMAVVCPTVWYNINGSDIKNWNTDHNETVDAGDGYQMLLTLFRNISDDYIGEMTDYKEHYLYGTENECNQADNVNTHCYSAYPYSSCYRHTFKMNSSEHSNVYCCGGQFACDGATFNAVGDYDYDYQNNGSHLYSNTVYCDGHGGCRSSEMYLNKNDKVYCRARMGCQTAHIFTFDKVYCLGQVTCGGASIIKHGTFVGCLGHAACRNLIMYNVRNVFVAGYKGLWNGHVISNGTDINIYIVGADAANSLTVECNNTDTCTMYCATYGACKNLFYFGCSDHNNSGNATLCSAKIIYLNGTDIDAVNTNQPSIYPTDYPSYEPSVEPTGEPTSSPLEISFVFDDKVVKTGRNATQSIQEWLLLLNNTQGYLSFGTKIGISIVATLELSDNENSTNNNTNNKTLIKLSNRLQGFLATFFNVTQTNVDVTVAFVNNTNENENETTTDRNSMIRLLLSHYAWNATEEEEEEQLEISTTTVASATTDVNIQIDTIIIIDDEIITNRNSTSLSSIDYQFVNSISNLTQMIFDTSSVEIQSILFNVSIVLVQDVDGGDNNENAGEKIPFITPELVAILTMVVMGMCCILPCVWCCFSYVGKTKENQQFIQTQLKIGSSTYSSER